MENLTISISASLIQCQYIKIRFSSLSHSFHQSVLDQRYVPRGVIEKLILQFSGYYRLINQNIGAREDLKCFLCIFLSCKVVFLHKDTKENNYEIPTNKLSYKRPLSLSTTTSSLLENAELLSTSQSSLDSFNEDKFQQNLSKSKLDTKNQRKKVKKESEQPTDIENELIKIKENIENHENTFPHNIFPHHKYKSEM